MGLDDKPLIKKQDLVRAIERHYMMQFTVDEVSLIGRFLRLEKQDKIEAFGCTTRQSRPTGRSNGAMALNALGPSVANGNLQAKDPRGLSSAIISNSTCSN